MRSVHLDFHTSEYIPDIGAQFDKKQFQAALKAGHISSVTLFAKCHHGWCYFPTMVGTMHPNLKFDLLRAQIEAAQEIGVKTPVYIPIGWSAKDASDHPEWRAVDFHTKDYAYYRYDPAAKPEDPKPHTSWISMCPSGPYFDHIYALTEEVLQTFPGIDGLFFDIACSGEACICPTCQEGMRKLGLDPEKEDDAKAYYTRTHREYMGRLSDLVHRYLPNGTVFYNSGGAEVSKPEYHEFSTHYELEDMPSAWGGYDRLSMRTKYFMRYGKEYLGMTGIFHTAWGEFGGFKSADALRYECANMLSLGAGCSIGDQLHPSGKCDMQVYEIIGEAFSYVEKLEEYAVDIQEISRLGLFLSSSEEANRGAVNTLQEAQIDFCLVDAKHLGYVKCVILPEYVELSCEDRELLKQYLAQGGKALLAGSATLEALGDFLGIEKVHPIETGFDYILCGQALQDEVLHSPFLAYTAAQPIHADGWEVLARTVLPYFDRTYGKYCSHRNTPYKADMSGFPAMVTNGNVVYIAHDIFSMYFNQGMLYHRKYAEAALRKIYEPDLKISGLMSSGRVRIYDQTQKGRLVLHLTYASPVARGQVLMIEDIPLIDNVKVELKTNRQIKAVFSAVDGRNVPFAQRNGVVQLMTHVKCHQLLVLEY